jgi:hypothetical protein
MGSEDLICRILFWDSDLTITWSIFIRKPESIIGSATIFNQKLVHIRSQSQDVDLQQYVQQPGSFFVT